MINKTGFDEAVGQNTNSQLGTYRYRDKIFTHDTIWFRLINANKLVQMSASGSGQIYLGEQLSNGPKWIKID